MTELEKDEFIAWQGRTINEMNCEMKGIHAELKQYKRLYSKLQKAYAKLEDRLARVHNISGEGR